MSSVRLTFLYPHLFRSIRVSEPAAQTVRQCRPRSSPHRAAFTSASRKEQRSVERHGKAVEPLLGLDEAKENTKVFMPESTQPLKESAKSINKKPDLEEEIKQEQSHISGQLRASSAAPLSKETQDAARIPGDLEPGDHETSAVDKKAAADRTVSPKAGIKPLQDGPLGSLLRSELSVEGSSDDLHIPHLHPPQFMHNFDTYTLVKEVEKGGFTTEQAITAMKAVRVLLANYLDVAKEELVSKSDVENETYLFHAACSELRTEIQNSRKATEEKVRQERTSLQLEVDILNQKLNQELLMLKDELTGMFNDRKMAVRMEQREMDSAIQELNYKITVALNSDAKSEVEGLRWVLTRRSVLAIVVMALMVLSSLRYASYRAHEEDLERKRQEKLKKEQRAHHRNGEGMAGGGTQTEAEEGAEKRGVPAGLAAETRSGC